MPTDGTPVGLDHYHIVKMPVAELLTKKDSRNPRKISDGALARLVHSLQEHGVMEPVVLNVKLDRLVGGHQRLEAAESLGIETFPVVLVEFDEWQHRAANAALNAEFGVWDEDMLRSELHEMQALGYDIDNFALQPWLVESLLAPPKEEELLSVPEPAAPLAAADEVECPRCHHVFTPALSGGPAETIAADDSPLAHAPRPRKKGRGKGSLTLVE